MKEETYCPSNTAMCIWFTGLSGSGKSTLSSHVANELALRAIQAHVLDGDALRRDLCKDLGFSREDRSENVRRAGEIAKQLVDKGILTLAAFMSPMTHDREFVRQLIGSQRFVEIYCKCSIDVCETRDPKGFYTKAKLDRLTNVIGWDEPYQEPQKPDLVIDTSALNVNESVAQIMSLLQSRKVIRPT